MGRNDLIHGWGELVRGWGRNDLNHGANGEVGGAKRPGKWGELVWGETGMGLTGMGRTGHEAKRPAFLCITSIVGVPNCDQHLIAITANILKNNKYFLYHYYFTSSTRLLIKTCFLVKYFHLSTNLHI